MLTGLDFLQRSRNSSLRRRLKGARVGLLSHHAAISLSGQNAIEVLEEIGSPPEVIFTPEHGFDAVAQAEESVGTDPASLGNARIISLYGEEKESLQPKAEELEGLDILLIDLVDVGARYYTYVWTALLTARAAAKAGVHCVILDRPNPLSGDPRTLEGRPQDEDLLSFVGLSSIPIRHGMTIGELLASILLQEDIPLGPDGALSVQPIAGWERRRLADAYGRPFIPPSPNMPTLQTALVYPGGCLLEGTNLSEGRGTTLPFQQLGAPFLDGQALARTLEIPGALLRPTRFKPTFDKFKDEVCNGLLLFVNDPQVFRPVEAYLSIVHAARQQAPDHFKFLERTYEFESAHPAFDLLTGTKEARGLIESGVAVEELHQLVCPVDEEWTMRLESAEELIDEIRA
ncbi:MAG: DUF1343 domain-containing protein [Polyangiaceae bacterium]|nr:DUF1343 domain-containing protein [Polyangiaceae bacterium]